MKKIFMMGCIAAAMFAGMVSCEEPETGYEGTNYVYLSADTNSMFDQDGASLTVNVTLTTSLTENLSLSFAMDENDYVELAGNPVTIPAGSTSSSFTVKVVKQLPESETMANFTITIDDETMLPENVALGDEKFTFTLVSSYVPELTDEQKAIVEAYKTASGGIDLTKYIGLIPVTAVYTASNPDSEIPLEPVTITGYSKITLSDKSVNGKPVLKMIANPMGLQDVLYEKLKDLTVENPYWTDPEAYQSYSQLMTAINWNSSSQETFSMTLDDINLDEAGTVDFIADKSYYDEYYEEDVELFIVPFEFEFSAYDRELVALENEQIGTVVDEFWADDATANPAYHLNCENTAEDYYEYGNWVKASASISAEKLEFTFCLYNYNDYDYSKVTATYTPNE